MKKLLMTVALLLLIQACFMVAAVLERLSAAVFKLYMSYFTWPQPIFLSLRMVGLFFAYSAVVVVLEYWLLKVTPSSALRTNKIIRWTICLNVGSALVLLLMILVKLAVPSDVF